MAWTTPRTWTDGETPTAAQLNTHLRDNLSYLYSADNAWTTPTVSGYGTLSGTRAFAYRIINGNQVQLRGTLQKSSGSFAAGNNDIATISALAAPVGLNFAVACNDTATAGRLFITIGGVIRFVAVGTGATWISVEGVTYYI